MREGGHEEKSNMIAMLGLNTYEGCLCETPPFDAPCDPPEMVELEQLPFSGDGIDVASTSKRRSNVQCRTCGGFLALLGRPDTTKSDFPAVYCRSLS